MIDSHAHLYLEEFDEDREAVIRRAREAGVKSIINIGSINDYIRYRSYLELNITLGII